MKMLTAPTCGLKKKRLPEAVHNILKDTARQRLTITYKELAHAVGLDWSRSYGQCRRLYPVLKGICRHETAQGKPMLGAIVVRRDGKPGQGFYRGARDLDRLKDQDKLSFWRDERDAVWQKWGGGRRKILTRSNR
jgi:hypothetical protein